MYADLLIDTGTVCRQRTFANPLAPGLPARVPPQDPGGGALQEYDPGESLACAIRPQAATRNADHDKQGGEVHVTVYFEVDPRVRTKDRLVWTAANGVSKADEFGRYPIVVFDGRVVSMAGYNGKYKATGVIRPV